VVILYHMMTTQTLTRKTDSPDRAARLRLALDMAKEAEAIGGRIRELRKGLGLTQREFAHRLPGKTEGKDVSRWENGKHRPSPDTLGHIADELETTVADLHAGPVEDREAQGPTPDPFTGRDEGNPVEALLRDIRAGQVEAAGRLLRIERRLEALTKQERRPAPRSKGGG
jgi:transcriptional regulator with XRE-family HTH domain